MIDRDRRRGRRISIEAFCDRFHAPIVVAIFTLCVFAWFEIGVSVFRVWCGR